MVSSSVASVYPPDPPDAESVTTRPPQAAQVQEYLEQVWGDAAQRFRLMAENTPGNTPENAG
jgi:hypothetical protein